MRFQNTFFLFLFAMISLTTFAQKQKVYVPGNFSKVTVSPHIEVSFQKGSEQKVELISITEPVEKFNLELKNDRLHLFLDDAKIVAKSKKEQGQNWSYNKPIYNGTVAKVLVTYTKLESCDLRGSEDFIFKSPISQHEFKLAVFGESKVRMKEVNVNDLRVSIYGESGLLIEEGKTDYQKFTAYGESLIDVKKVKNEVTKLTAYGSGVYKLNPSKKLKVTSFGESTIEYNGVAALDKRLIVGETRLIKK